MLEESVKNTSSMTRFPSIRHSVTTYKQSENGIFCFYSRRLVEVDEKRSKLSLFQIFTFVMYGFEYILTDLLEKKYNPTNHQIFENCNHHLKVERQPK